MLLRSTVLGVITIITNFFFIGDCPILLVWGMDLDDIRPQHNEIEERIWKVHKRRNRREK